MQATLLEITANLRIMRTLHSAALARTDHNPASDVTQLLRGRYIQYYSPRVFGTRAERER